MKLADLLQRVRLKTQPHCGDCPPASIDEVVRATVEELGLFVDNAGTIYDPAPARPQLPSQQNVHFRGPRRKR
jgi:hypothetical protein